MVMISLTLKLFFPLPLNFTTGQHLLLPERQKRLAKVVDIAKQFK
jgi:hypothetical protein